MVLSCLWQDGLVAVETVLISSIDDQAGTSGALAHALSRSFRYRQGWIDTCGDDPDFVHRRSPRLPGAGCWRTGLPFGGGAVAHFLLGPGWRTRSVHGEGVTIVSGGISGRLRVQLLGAVRAWRDEDELCLGAPRQKVVLAVLAMRAGLGVSRDELVDAVWDDPPGNAVNSVHIYVAGLREVLEPGRARRAPGTVLVTGGPGYLLPLEPGQVDAAVFRGHLAAARRSRTDGDLAAAAESLDAALGLWQGNPLAGIGGPWAQIERVRLSEARLAAVEDRAEV